ncbi:MAG TPA: DUF559 domain-containing protein [Chloroflexota bacterium]|nr:DUF559 domain-containing protein [Chloroflexota bacterium]
MGAVLAELQRFIWEWPTLLDRLRSLNPALGDEVGRSTRPIEAERRPDGRLLLVLGCWVTEDRSDLNKRDVHTMLEHDFKRLLGESIQLLVTNWPAGDGPADSPPDPLSGLAEPLHDLGASCGGSLHRTFFAAAARRGIIFECQYPVLNYRIDFALPPQRLGVEIGGWSWRAWTRPNAVERREREQSLGAEGWAILWFTGDEIVHHLERSVDEVARVIAQRRPSRISSGAPRRTGKHDWTQ